MSQPIWKLVGNIGDVNFEYGAAYVFVDERGEYPPEMETVEPNDYLDNFEDNPTYTVSRVILEPCTYIGGILSDNQFHPDAPVWYTQDLAMVAESCGQSEEDLRTLLLSADPIERARGYDELISYFGIDEFDAYPEQFSEAEYRKRVSEF